MVIGRGGRSYWVDLKLETLPDVSREHCRIRRDAETGRFTIEDLSQFGTAVNGKPVGKNTSMELPPRGTISLAGVLDLKWESASMKDLLVGRTIVLVALIVTVAIIALLAALRERR